MYRWPTTRRVGDSKTEDWLFEVCEDAIPDDYRISGRDPQLKLVLTPVMVVDRYLRWEGRLALLAADSILIAGRTKSFGFRADTHSWDRWDIRQYALGMWSGRYYTVEALDDYGAGPKFMFHDRHEADALGDFFANG